MSLRVTPVMSVLCSVSASSSFFGGFFVYKEKFSLKEDGCVLFDLVKCPNPHQKKPSKTGKTSEKPDLQPGFWESNE